MDFILRPLVFGKSSGYSKNNDVEFIKKLPVSIRRWFLAEYLCIMLCGIAFLVAGVLLYFEGDI
ncbi:hypothetical protein BMI79_15430 [Serratia oryzae]|uniref:Uncharacterized protein n=2 Tax=Serratia oryzae TaxID=2034155 RepID=A0A1S8CJE4_9GAMM|nr:hypothetical protein BMI79_15430 [Serratia oryzae]